MIFRDPQSTCEQSEQSTTAHQLDNPLHHWLEYRTAYSALDSSDKPAHRHILALAYRHILAPAHHHHHHHHHHHERLHKKIRDFNVKYYAAWAIEAREALEECGWMRWIDPATPTKEIKEEDGSEIDIVEGL
jgi:hypothetical protein